MKALQECTCNVQPLQELAHEATLNFSLDETISGMMVHIGDAVQSTGKTVLQEKAGALLGTLFLASDVTGQSGGALTVEEVLEELAAFDRTPYRFEIGGGSRGSFPKIVRKSRNTCGGRVRILHSLRLATVTAHIRFDFLLGAGATDAERANHSEVSCPHGAATHAKILG